MVGRYPGEDAFLGSHGVGNWNTPHPTSVLKLSRSFLPSPHPQVFPPVSRERIARSYAPLLIQKLIYREVKHFSSFPAVSLSKQNFMMSMLNLSEVLIEQIHEASEITVILRTASLATVCPCCFCVRCVHTDLCGRIFCVGRKSFRA
jgi:hypothetical protein